MRVRKAIKKVAAIGVGASMLGATLVGAAAANLGNYPDMLITGGSFDGVIVLGDNAIASDTLGAVDIATGLTVSGSSGSSSTSGVTIAGGSVIRTSGDDLNIDESINQVEASLDVSDVPSVLADGLFDDTEGENDNEESFDQEIAFGANTGTLVLYQDADDNADEGGLYVFIDRGTGLYNYTLEFDDSVEYDDSSDSAAEDDFETVKIDIQGNTYTIVGVKLDGTAIDELQLQAGDTTIWLEQSQPITRVIGGEEHEIELVDVNENEDKCGVTVDGTLQWVDVGQTKRINGVEVGVTDAITVHSEAQDTDVCELNLGAQEVILEEGQEVKINGKDIDGSLVTFDAADGDNFDGFTISYDPEDDTYLGPGDSWQDPVLGNFEISFEGVVANTEEVVFDSSGEDLTITFLNTDGKEIEIPLFCENDCDGTGDILLGEGDEQDELVYLQNGVCSGTTDVADCEGAKFLVTQGDEVHLIEIDNVDESDNEITVEDLTYGGTKTTDGVDYLAAGQVVNVELPAGGQYAVLTINGSQITFTGGAGDDIVDIATEMETMYEHTINIDADINPTVSITENADEEDNDASADVIAVDFSQDTTDDEIDVDSPDMGANEAANGPVDVSESDDDNTIDYSGFGTRAERDSEEGRSLTLFLPAEELYANVFVGPTGADVRIATGAAAAVQVGAAKLASEVSDLSAQNTIIVGGPCANAAAAEFLGVSQANCSEGAPQENTAEIVAKDMDGVVSILVNGYDALDTRRAARVLYNYNDYPLAGEKVVVSGASLSDISVSAAQ